MNKEQIEDEIKWCEMMIKHRQSHIDQYREKITNYLQMLYTIDQRGANVQKSYKRIDPISKPTITNSKVARRSSGIFSSIWSTITRRI